MSDSSMSASELRRRYGAGGELPDNELTASQLRARHAIRSNQKDFSTSTNAVASNGNGGVLIGIILLVISLAAFGGVAAYLGWIKL